MGGLYCRIYPWDYICFTNLLSPTKVIKRSWITSNTFHTDQITIQLKCFTCSSFWLCHTWETCTTTTVHRTRDCSVGDLYQTYQDIKWHWTPIKNMPIMVALLSGVSYSLLEFPQQELKYLKYDCFNNLRHFLLSIQVSVKISNANTMIPIPLRLLDHSIMGQIIKICDSKKDLERFNIVRIWLRVYSIVEISTADGTLLIRSAWKGNNTFNPNTLWPYQEEPNITSKRTWRRLLSKALLTKHTSQRITENSPDLTLSTSLKELSSSFFWFWRQWLSQYSCTTKHLYIRSAVTNVDVYNVHQRLRHSCRQLCPSHFQSMLYNPRPFTTIFSCLHDTTPIDTIHEGKFIGTTILWRTIEDNIPPVATTWKYYVLCLPDWDQTLIQKHLPVWEDTFLSSLLQGKSLFICSDGGATLSYGSYTAVIANSLQILIAITGRAHRLLQRSFWAEYYGILAILRYLLQQSIFHKTRFCSQVELYCDNLGAIKRLTTTNFNNSPWHYLYSEMDIEMQMNETLQ